MKLRLTEESELGLFGSLHPWRDSVLPSIAEILDGIDTTRTAIGYLSEDQAAIYNDRIERVYTRPDNIAKLKVRPGVVRVSQRDCVWDVHLENINEEQEGREPVEQAGGAGE